MKKALAATAIAFVIWFIAYRPSDAATVTTTMAATLADIGDGIGDFVTAIAGDR